MRKVVPLISMACSITPRRYGQMSSQLRKLNTLHYKALRSSLGQIRNKTPRRTLDEIFKRATPNYSYAKLAINLYLNTPISLKLYNSAYMNDRTKCVPYGYLKVEDQQKLVSQPSSMHQER